MGADERPAFGLTSLLPCTYDTRTQIAIGPGSVEATYADQYVEVNSNGVPTIYTLPALTVKVHIRVNNYLGTNPLPLKVLWGGYIGECGDASLKDAPKSCNTTHCSYSCAFANGQAWPSYGIAYSVTVWWFGVQQLDYSKFGTEVIVSGTRVNATVTDSVCIDERAGLIANVGLDTGSCTDGH